MEDVERQWCERVALNVAVSDQDRQLLQRLAPAARIAVVPNGVDVEEFRPAAGDGRGLAFVGGLPWFPNRDALDFFGEAILPQVRAVERDLPVVWIGSASAEERRHYGDRFGVEEVGGVAKHAMLRYFDFVAAGLDLTPVITHRFPLERWDEAVLALKNARRTGAVKVLLEP